VVAAGVKPVSLEVGLTRAAVANQGDSTITSYEVNQDGTLSPLGSVDAGMAPGAIESQFGYDVIGSAYAVNQFVDTAESPGRAKRHGTFAIATPHLPSCLVEGINRLYVGDADANAITTYGTTPEGGIVTNYGAIPAGGQPIALCIPNITGGALPNLYALTADGVISKYNVSHGGNTVGAQAPLLVSSIKPPQRAVAMQVFADGTRDFLCTVTDQNNFQVFLASGVQIIPKLAFSAATGTNPTAIAVVDNFIPVTTTPGQINTTIK
jgi:hypothetical protein